MAAETLYREKRLSVSAIAGKLHISKSTLYGYLRHRGVEVGPYNRTAQTRPGGSAEASGDSRTSTVVLWLRVENNNKFVRGKKRVKESIDLYLRHQYAAKLRPSGQYELKVPYRSDEELDRTLKDLLQHITREAALHNCFSESAAELEGSNGRTC